MDRKALIWDIKSILESEVKIDIHFEISNLDEVAELIMKKIEAAQAQ